ncbi:hypothetical protein GIW05_01205 [Pseudomonas syringae]|uniref:hypothetical protein n=1 Tax=Pseudomonas syringae TaxID=317 RepID=UPI001F4607CB|nr:hypothetical protein [Pseudomonas syringae]MCF5382140.1 hypothetical protein [Pseudomonas syringae]MCF5423527.1 hypothetical protein [Pseudomonas syringae]MCF5455211.1 hypothetical protein [Pseudomonas syringae]MCF5460419.1 hypothetical protein [Pseudomonas syringae]
MFDFNLPVAAIPENCRECLPAVPSLEGYEAEYAEPKAHQFLDASISVVFAKWNKPLAKAAQPPSVPLGSMLAADAQEHFKKAS